MASPPHCARQKTVPCLRCALVPVCVRAVLPPPLRLASVARVGVEVSDGGDIADITKANGDIPNDMRSLLSMEGGVAKAKAYVAPVCNAAAALPATVAGLYDSMRPTLCVARMPAPATVSVPFCAGVLLPHACAERSSAFFFLSLYLFAYRVRWVPQTESWLVINALLCVDNCALLSPPPQLRGCVVPAPLSAAPDFTVRPNVFQPNVALYHAVLCLYILFLFCGPFLSGASLSPCLFLPHWLASVFRSAVAGAPKIPRDQVRYTCLTCYTCL